jgi:hypothetical protein
MKKRLMRAANFAISINKCKNINSCDINRAPLTTYVIINEEDFSRLILEDDSLGANETEDEDIIQ